MYKYAANKNICPPWLSVLIVVTTMWCTSFSKTGSSYVFLCYNLAIQHFYIPLPVAISCGEPPAAPANGTRSFSNTTFGSTVTYTCNQGYSPLPQGSNAVTCLANGQWNGSAPQCNGISYIACYTSVSPLMWNTNVHNIILLQERVWMLDVSCLPTK